MKKSVIETESRELDGGGYSAILRLIDESSDGKNIQNYIIEGKFTTRDKVHAACLKHAEMLGVHSLNEKFEHIEVDI